MALLVLPGFPSIAASQLNTHLLKRRSVHQILNVSLAFSAILILTLAVLNASGVSSLWLLLPVLFGCIGTLGFITPNGLARASAASALFDMLPLGIAAIASAALSLWHTQNELPLAVIMACCICGAYLMLKLSASTEISAE
jgi:hypothetical protein